MPPIIHAKAISGNVTRSWEVDIEFIVANYRWATRRPQRLTQELVEMVSSPALTTHFLTLRNEDDFYGVWLCKRCKEPVVFWEGLRCPNCEQLYTIKDSLLAFYGRIPSPIGRIENEVPRGRPVFKKIMRLLPTLPTEQKSLWQSYLLRVGDQFFFSPPVISVFSSQWPSSPPMIHFRKEYWKILGIPPTHIYGGGTDGVNTHQLCLFAHWREQTMREILEQRVVPRVVIELMFGDLAAVDKLDQALRDLGTNWGAAGMYQIYNWIGRGRGSERFGEVYNRYVTLD